MANTYTQIYIQFVFAPKYRTALIQPKWEDELYMYITGIVQKNKHKMISINGVADHIHLLVGLHTDQSIADLMHIVKANSTKWINERRFLQTRFEWQTGYGGFSYSRSQLSRVSSYIENQKSHHLNQTFKDEYTKFLNNYEVEFDDRYIFVNPI